jgi:predicted amidohydrolase
MKVALIQTQWVDDPAEGLETAYRSIQDATSGGDIDVVLFPEFLLGPPWYMPGQDHLQGRTDTPIPSPIIDRFQSLAAEARTNVVLGTIVEALDNGKYRNTSLVIDRDGQIVGRAIKAHAFGNEMVVCEQADNIGVLNTDVGTIGVAVCSDFWIPEVIRIQALAGAHTIFVPGGTLLQNQDLMVNALSSTAYLNGVNIVYASSVGVVRGMRGERLVEINFSGTSLVATPERVVARASQDAPEILTVDLGDINPDGDWRPWRELRKPGAYERITGQYVGVERDLAAELQANIASSTLAGAPAEVTASAGGNAS